MNNYTQEQLSEMSDFEVNKAVAEKLGFKVFTSLNNDAQLIESGYLGRKLPDYCNSWEYAGPIIEKYRISIEFRNTSSTLPPAARFGDTFVPNKNPLRAAMYCFLIMEGI